MAQQASYKSTVAVADPELARRKMEPDSTDAEAAASLSEQEQAEVIEVNNIIDARKRYAQDRKAKEHEWTESFKMYMSWVDKTLNPFLSNLFIPKTHEAVELLAAFLIGSNQTVSATPENNSSNTTKARVASKWLDFLWRKVVKARIKTLVWIKQTIIFGNGIIKFGWDPDEKKPWMSVCAIEDVYFDYFEPYIGDSEYIIHEIRKDPDDVKNDTKYDLADGNGKLIREQVITGGESFDTATKGLFSTYDGSLMKSENKGKVLIMEVWCDKENGAPQRLKTLLPTKGGWRIARDVENPNRYSDGQGKPGEQFRPFVKSRLKVSPLPNRAYDISGVFPTVHIQKAFNDLMRQYFDIIQMTGSPMGKKRRGARINPSELVRRPGGIITMGDISKDFAWDQAPDVKNSMIEMLNRLDSEFQQASMIVNLLKSIPNSDTATEAQLAQSNSQTLLDMVNQNIVDALSEAGQMLLAISLLNSEGKQSLVLYETDKEIATLDFDPKDIDGMHEIRIVPDRKDNTTKAGQNAGLVKVYPLIANDTSIVSKYPTIKEKFLTRILQNEGVADTDFFFQEEGAPQPTQQGPKETVSINYKDAPPDIQRQMEQAAGFKPSEGQPVKSPVQSTRPADKTAVVQ